MEAMPALMAPIGEMEEAAKTANADLPLKHGQKAVEMRAGDPALIIDQIAPDHGDLCDRASEGEQSKAQEAEEKRDVTQCGRFRFTVDVCHRHCSGPNSQCVEKGAELG